MSLENESPEPFRYSRTSVTHVSFSHDSNYMATAVSTSLCSVFFMNRRVKEPGESGGYIQVKLWLKRKRKELVR